MRELAYTLDRFSSGVLKISRFVTVAVVVPTSVPFLFVFHFVQRASLSSLSNVFVIFSLFFPHFSLQQIYYACVFANKRARDRVCISHYNIYLFCWLLCARVLCNAQKLYYCYIFCTFFFVILNFCVCLPSPCTCVQHILWMSFFSLILNHFIAWCTSGFLFLFWFRLAWWLAAIFFVFDVLFFFSFCLLFIIKKRIVYAHRRYSICHIEVIKCTLTTNYIACERNCCGMNENERIFFLLLFCLVWK